MDKIQVVWFENNLRTTDHQGLHQATQHETPIIGVYVLESSLLEPTRYGFPKLGPYRLEFIDETLKTLKQNLQKHNIPLVIYLGNAYDAFRKLSKQYHIDAIHYEKAYASEEDTRHQSVIKAFPSTSFYAFDTKPLMHIRDLPFDIQDLPLSFTAFRKRVEKTLKIKQEVSIDGFKQSKTISVNNSDTFDSLYEKTSTPFVKGGEDEALKRLNYYLFESKKIKTYKETRNQMDAFDASSKLSPYLAIGALSPRTVYYQLKVFEQKHGSNDSTYWLFFELLWRDYFHYLLVRFGRKVFYKNGLFNTPYHPNENKNHIEAWKNANTGYPLVDANMREINTTGYMSNRGRQNVASFFCHYLKQDWRIGAAYFEYLLIDYDVASNYGNWLYLAGLGVDPRGTRIFDVINQGNRYDPTTEYLLKWLPELEPLPKQERYQGLSKNNLQQNLNLFEVDYPKPIVDKPIFKP